MNTANTQGRPGIAKAPTGIAGFDEITGGGLPKGRPSLFCGAAGCGKTLFAMEFLVRGATEFGEPGLFVSFEETEKDLAENVASLGFDLPALIERDLVAVDHIVVDRDDLQGAGDYDLEGLFVRLGHAVDSVGAKRVVLDTLETLFGGIENDAVLRSELRRLFHWLKEREITAVITGERGDGAFTRQGLEEYVSDCVVLLDHRVNDQVSTRRLRIVKYRGSLHGANEYPFLIDEDGISVLPITSSGLEHAISSDRVSSGVPELDAMLGGGGFYRGSSVLVSGAAGTGKSTLGAHFAYATCEAGERFLYFGFEESAAQIVRNMGTIGIDLKRHLESGLLRVNASRPTNYGLEMHLAIMLKEIERFRPSAVAIDPVTTFLVAGTSGDAQAMLMRLIDYLKAHRITGFFASLTSSGASAEGSTVGLSSLMDTWLLVRDLESNGERNRGLYVIKSRGMDHSNQVREFVIAKDGVHLLDVYVGADGVLTGTARMVREEQDRRLAREALRAATKRKTEAERRIAVLQAQLVALQAELESERADVARTDRDEFESFEFADQARIELARARGTKVAE